ncbi:MAG: serine/threonine protein kinase [Myxococcales bacterium]|nr:serine/threonine protein kinase [Myxococcales bacterium]
MNQTLPPTSSSLVAGKYQLVRRIGQGGMGSVWEGRHASLGTRVAIKFIEADYADNGEARSRFDREAKAAASIQSKHAIQIFDHGVTDDGKPYIVMEMLSGEPLDKRIQRLGRLPLQDTARILQQVGRALGQAHEKGIVHRDLKPENIFLVHDEDDELAKVLDFGIAKIQSGADGSPGLTSSTKTGAVLGTPYYMSPEQARGLRNVDHRTDVWSVGVIAYRAVTGHLPFEGESVGDLLVKICTSPVPVPSHALPGLPPAFDAWFARCLEREPSRRFSTIGEATDALSYAAGITVRGRGPTTSGVPILPTQIDPPLPVAPTAMLGSQGTAAPFTANAVDEGTRRSGGSRGLIVGALVGVVVLAGVVGGALALKGGSKGTTAAAISASPPPPESHTAQAPTAPLPSIEQLPTASAPAVAAVVPDKGGKTVTKPTVTPGKPGKPEPATKPSGAAPPPPQPTTPPPPPPPPPPAKPPSDHHNAGY